MSAHKRPASRAKAESIDLDALVAAMIATSESSGKILHRFFTKGERLGVREKSQNMGLVTNADLASEENCVKRLKRAQPAFAFYTEEETEVRAIAGKNVGRFFIDPLDGTTNFVHGFPMFCVSIGAEWNGKLVAGVIHHPILKETYVAWRGGGAWLNGKRIQVSPTRKIEESLLTTGFSVHGERKTLPTEMVAFKRLSGLARGIRRPGSAALDLAYTARGVFDGYWERSLAPWDTAAGALLVSEAGGKVTDLDGKPFHVHAPSILATNGRLHAELMRADRR